MQLNPNASATSAVVPFSPTAGIAVAVIKATPGNLFGITVCNQVAAVTYLQFFNATATPTLGTSVLFSIPIPAGAGTGTLIIPPSAFALANFSAGIAIGAATTATGSTAPATAPTGTIFYL